MVLLREGSHEYFREGQDVSLPLPEGRQSYVDGVEPVIQIFPETSFPDKCLKVHVRGADQSYVHRLGLVASDTDHIPALDGPQELRLEVERNIPDFVQE